MKAEVLAIGSELLLGEIVDTNTCYIAKVLAENGIELIRASMVGDDAARIEEAIREGISRASILITTGGLGPTEDDLTRESVAHVTGRPLVFQPQLMEQIEALFKRRGFRMVESNRRQAFIPEGAIPIENPKGTAPGFIVEDKNWAILSIPGVPFEMKYLMSHSVIPYLRRRFQINRQVIQYRVLRACGLGESAIGTQIGDLMKKSLNPSVGTLASIGDIRIRITAKAESPEVASQMIHEMEEEIRRRLGFLIYGVDEETLQGNTVKMLERLGLTLSTVETFTGGILAAKLVETGSPTFLGGHISPSVASQRRFLGLEPEAFEQLSNNPRELTEAFAKTVNQRSGSDLGLAVFTQVLETKPEEVRLRAFFSLSTAQGMDEQEQSLGGEASMLRERTSIIALDFLRRYLRKIVAMA